VGRKSRDTVSLYREKSAPQAGWDLDMDSAETLFQILKNVAMVQAN
jgi:hypothetical protein